MENYNAYRAGYESVKKGLSSDANPYLELGGELSASWNRGFDEFSFPSDPADLVC